MSRLIDADEVIKYIKNWEIGTSISSDQKEFIDCINEQPTAFDADKVIEQIDGLKDAGLYDGFMVWNVLSDYELLRSYKEAFE